jgi:hypothetical protein
MPNPKSAAQLAPAGKDDVMEERVCANLKAMTVPSPVDLAWHALSCRVVDRQTGKVTPDDDDSSKMYTFSGPNIRCVGTFLGHGR